MEQITVAAKIQIITSDKRQVLLNNTMAVYRKRANYSKLRKELQMQKHHLQEEDSKLLDSEKTVGCKMLSIKYQRHSLRTIQSIHYKKKHLFTCKNCGYQPNDDRIGAMNLYRMGINYLVDSQVPSAVTTE